MRWLIFVFCAAIPLTGFGDTIATRAELDAILSGSEEYLEDFEEVSFHAGSSVTLPNPFNNITGFSSGWGDLIPGITYGASNSLQMWAWFFQGDDSNLLRGFGDAGNGDLTIEFDQPQVAIGFDLVGGGSTLHQIVTFYRDQSVIGSMEFDILPGQWEFVGWQDRRGISSVHITTTASGTSSLPTTVDNVAWGLVATALFLPADSLTVVRGVQTGGAIGDLIESDDVDFSVQRNPLQTSGIIEIEFKAVSQIADPDSFEFTLEAAGFFRSTVVQSIEFYDFDAGVFVEVDSRNASRFTDSIAFVSGNGDLSRFIEVGTGCVQARILYTSLSRRQAFSAAIDQVFWTVE